MFFTSANLSNCYLKFDVLRVTLIKMAIYFNTNITNFHTEKQLQSSEMTMDAETHTMNC